MRALHFADKFPLDYFPILANLFLILANYLSIFHCHLCQRHIGNWSIGIRNREIVAYRRANKCPNFESNKVTSALMQLLVFVHILRNAWFLFVFHVDVCRTGWLVVFVWLVGWLVVFVF